MNYLKTGMLIAAITAIFLGVGAMIGGQQGMIIAFVIAVGMNFFAYWNSDKMVLRMYGAKEVDATTAPEFYKLVGGSCHAGGFANATGLHHGKSAAKRVCDRSEP
ncbi:MAG: hypothetical protein JJ879_00560 [Sneathiella sp.]|nr:hypothetical protein [Sneathiella sp.]